MTQLENRLVTEFGKLQNATRYAFTDDAGNEATFSPDETLEILDYLLLKAQDIIRARDAEKSTVSEKKLNMEEIGAEITFYTEQLSAIRKKLKAINKMIDQEQERKSL